MCLDVFYNDHTQITFAQHAKESRIMIDNHDNLRRLACLTLDRVDSSKKILQTFLSIGTNNNRNIMYYRLSLYHLIALFSVPRNWINTAIGVRGKNYACA